MIECSIPGKLYIAGEYAVVNEDHPAILVAVNKFLKVQVEIAKDEGSITTFDKSPIPWKRNDNKRLVLDERDDRLAYVISSINTVETYAKELKKDLQFYHLRVFSDLESDCGLKYGLGSSAAVTIATISALCKVYNIEINKEELYKLSVLAQLNIKDSGSFGDIAASVFGGWIVYKRFYREWLLEKRKNLNIGELLELKWKGLSIEKLNPPEELNLVIGWTGIPASTVKLVDKVEEKENDSLEIYSEFLRNSKSTVEKIIDGFKNSDLNIIRKYININGELLNKLGYDLGIEIETPMLKKLCTIAKEYGGHSKSSGAGGGDCGIAVFNNDYNKDALIEKWNKENIKFLDLKVIDIN